MRISDWSSDVCSSDLAAYDYLFYSGYMALAYWWARSVAAAETSSQPQAFKDAKRETARFYFTRILPRTLRSEEHTSELQSLMRISYAVFCLKKKTSKKT